MLLYIFFKLLMNFENPDFLLFLKISEALLTLNLVRECLATTHWRWGTTVLLRWGIYSLVCHCIHWIHWYYLPGSGRQPDLYSLYLLRHDMHQMNTENRNDCQQLGCVVPVQLLRPCGLKHFLLCLRPRDGGGDGDRTSIRTRVLQ